MSPVKRKALSVEEHLAEAAAHEAVGTMLMRFGYQASARAKFERAELHRWQAAQLLDPPHRQKPTITLYLPGQPCSSSSR